MSNTHACMYTHTYTHVHTHYTNTHTQQWTWTSTTLHIQLTLSHEFLCCSQLIMSTTFKHSGGTENSQFHDSVACRYPGIRIPARQKGKHCTFPLIYQRWLAILTVYNTKPLHYLGNLMFTVKHGAVEQLQVNILTVLALHIFKNSLYH